VRPFTSPPEEAGRVKLDPELRRRYRSIGVNLGIRVECATALSVLRRLGPLSAGALGDTIGVTHRDARVILGELGRFSLVQSAKGKANRYELTEAGREFVDACTPPELRSEAT
jgi:DNA-binding MarR family transcriptional regulator